MTQNIDFTIEANGDICYVGGKAMKYTVQDLYEFLSNLDQIPRMPE